MKDYTNQLEDILEKKSFSVEVKNILLSMLYKIDISYNDYFTVKRNVEDKKSYIEGLLNTIETCNSITLIKTISDNDKENIYTKFKINSLKREIEVYPNEKAMLYALNDLNYTKMYLNENYKLIRNSLPYLINKGREINDTEIIRDFDAWTWNVQIDEIPNVEINLIYQNMQLLLGYSKLNELLNLKALKSDLELLEKSLKLLYGEEIASKFLELLYKISIILYVNENEQERQRLFEEKKWIEKEYNRLSNKKKLLEDITNSKKAIMNKIKDIDIILSNKKLLIEEYNKRNDSLPEHSKIFSLSHFSEILLREREKELGKIDEYNKIIEPKNYANIKYKFEKDLELLSNIKLDGTIKNSTLKPMIKLQELFLDCFEIQIEKSDEKNEIIYLLYALRYYNFIPFSKNQLIKDVKELKYKLLELENMLIEKMYLYKVVNKNMDLNIIDKIFDTKILSLENIQFSFKNDNEKIILNLFDEETLAETMSIDRNDIDIKKIKFNKKYKLFN